MLISSPLSPGPSPAGGEGRFMNDDGKAHRHFACTRAFWYQSRISSPFQWITPGKRLM